MAQALMTHCTIPVQWLVSGVSTCAKAGSLRAVVLTAFGDRAQVRSVSSLFNGVDARNCYLAYL
jgi:hypothetical protein